MTGPSSSRSFAVVPAAGQSARMGRPKLLLPWRETTVLQSTLSAWQAGGVTHIIVVVPPDNPAVLSIAHAAGAEVVVPAEQPRQMRDSIRLALRHIAERFRPAASDAWLLAPADMPWLSPTVVRRLLTVHQPNSPAILVPVHNSTRGHPVLFPWSCAEDVEQLRPDDGVNTIKQRRGWTPVEVDEPLVLGDLDTPEDYAAAIRPWTDNSFRSS